MSRTCKRIPFTANFDIVNQTIINILKSEGFNEKSINGENCWRKGIGAVAMQYVKVEYAEKEVILYGWIQVGIGAVVGKEMDLKGFVGMIPKKQLQKRLDKIEKAVLSLK